MNKLQKMILSLGNGVVYVAVAVICLYLFLLSIFTTCFMVYSDEHIFYVKDFAIILCTGLLCLCVLLAIIRAKMTIFREIEVLKRIALIITVMLSVIMAAFILYLKLPPIYDQGTVYYAAGRLLSGDFTEWTFGEYFSMLPYQNGMVLMMCPFVAIFKTNAYLAIQLFNIPVLFLSYIGISKIAEMYFGKKSGVVTYLALLAVVPMWTYVTFVYGTIPALCLCVWAIYLELLFERTEKWGYAVGCGLCTLFAIMWKSNAQIFALAIGLMLLMHAVRIKSWKPLMAIVILAGFCVLEIKGVPYIMHLITGENTTNGIPMIAWLAMGLQESVIAPGWYNEFPMNLYRHVSTDQQVITQEVMNSFRDSFTLFAEQKDYCLRFFARKTASMWADPAFQFFTIANTRNLYSVFPYVLKDLFYNGGIMNTIVYLLFDVLQSIQYFGVILYLILKRKDLKLEHAHMLVCILGGFLFHFIGEAKSQYVIPYYLLMVPYVVQGYREATDRIIDWKNQKTPMKQAVRTGTFRIAAVLTVCILLIWSLNSTFITSSIKLGGEESDYIWYCQNRTEWQDENYHKD